MRDLDDSSLQEIKTKVKISALPGSNIEINTIKEILSNNLYNVTVYSAASATEENLKEINSPKLLHIATHGYFLDDRKKSKIRSSISNIYNSSFGDDPYLKSGLLFAGAQNTINRISINTFDNGILTAAEVKELNFKNTDLVILSACETGLGVNLTGEGIIGLPRAFMIAGAKSVIMSLWSVSDEKTNQLMVKFYSNWVIKKMTKEDALFSAKKELKNIYPEPYFWAGFILLE